MQKLRIETQLLIKISILIICALLDYNPSYCQDAINGKLTILSEEEIKYINQIEINGNDSIKIDFEGKKVAFTSGGTGLFPISKKEFFDSKVKNVAVIDLSSQFKQNNTPYDLIVISSERDLKRKVRRRLRKRQKN
ncbi:MAG: hypothetical protein ACERIH_00695 [Labilibaculum antarcticum]